MKQSVIVSVLISKDFIEIIANQKINNDDVCLFNKRKIVNDSSLAHVFIKTSLSEIEQRTMTKIEKVNLILDDYSLKNDHLKVETKVLDKTFKNFKSSAVLNEINYWEFQKSIKNDITNSRKNDSKKLIELIPLKFVTKDGQTGLDENFTVFPNGKSVSQISCSFSALFISSKFYESILALFDSVNIKFHNVLLLSQLSFYKFDSNISNKLTFTLDIQAKKSILITSINRVVIGRNELKFSYDDLISKISQNFDIPTEITNSLIQTYGMNFASHQENLNEIVYISNDNDRSITKKDLKNIIKSFLKTLSIEVKEIIDQKSNKNTMDFNINIIGKLEKFQNVEEYCAKYLETKNIISNRKTSETFYTWNKSYQTHLGLLKFIDVINEKISSFAFSKLVNHKQRAFKFNKKKNSIIALQG